MSTDRPTNDYMKLKQNLLPRERTEPTKSIARTTKTTVHADLLTRFDKNA
jgi:hypothetical protein